MCISLSDVDRREPWVGIRNWAHEINRSQSKTYTRKHGNEEIVCKHHLFNGVSASETKLARTLKLCTLPICELFFLFWHAPRGHDQSSGAVHNAQ